jgi:hypothetical protein
MVFDPEPFPLLRGMMLSGFVMTEATINHPYVELNRE